MRNGWDSGNDFWLPLVKLIFQVDYSYSISTKFFTLARSTTLLFSIIDGGVFDCSHSRSTTLLFSIIDGGVFDCSHSRSTTLLFSIIDGGVFDCSRVNIMTRLYHNIYPDILILYLFVLLKSIINVL
jgi:hypothetical protein